MKKLVLMIAFASLVGCGGGDEEAADAVTPAATEQSERSNPLATQQQAIQDAQAIQGILDKDAEEKKKKLDEIN